MAPILPPDFHLGCATSAYQVEGGIETDWTAWERSGRGVPANGRAVDHWRRMEADLDLLAELGATAYRFSVEWARVEPEPGRFDGRAIERYGSLVQGLLNRGIEPMVTFLHFTHPPWFHQRCPWHALGSQAPGRFAAFVARMMETFRDRVTWFTILNEPMAWLLASTLSGVVPPGEKNLGRFTVAAQTLLLGYLEARDAIRARHPGARCGIAKNVIRFGTDRGTRWERWMVRVADQFYNHAFVQALTEGVLHWGPGLGPGFRRSIERGAGALDFLGVNYYTRIYLRCDPWRAPRLHPFYEGRTEHGVSDLGWEVHPDGLREALLELRRYQIPVWITENGIDDRDDSRRSRYLVDHLAAALDARARGMDVRGYLHWSLLDNFEWLEGFAPRFGLYRVERPSLKRVPTRAAETFRSIAETRRLPDPPPVARVRPGGRRSVLPT